MSLTMYQYLQSYQQLLLYLLNARAFFFRYEDSLLKGFKGFKGSIQYHSASCEFRFFCAFIIRALWKWVSYVRLLVH